MVRQWSSWVVFGWQCCLYENYYANEREETDLLSSSVDNPTLFILKKNFSFGSADNWVDILICKHDILQVIKGLGSVWVGLFAGWKGNDAVNWVNGDFERFFNDFIEQEEKSNVNIC